MMFYFLGSFFDPLLFCRVPLSFSSVKVYYKIIPIYSRISQIPTLIALFVNFKFPVWLIISIHIGAKLFLKLHSNFYTTKGYENCNLTPKNLASMLSLWPYLSLSKENSIPSLFTFFYISVRLISLLTHAMPMLLCTCYHYRSLMK
jgi:hypothetical protein